MGDVGSASTGSRGSEFEYCSVMIALVKDHARRVFLFSGGLSLNRGMARDFIRDEFNRGFSQDQC